MSQTLQQGTAGGDADAASPSGRGLEEDSDEEHVRKTSKKHKHAKAKKKRKHDDEEVRLGWLSHAMHAHKLHVWACMNSAVLTLQGKAAGKDRFGKYGVVRETDADRSVPF